MFPISIQTSAFLEKQQLHFLRDTRRAETSLSCTNSIKTLALQFVRSIFEREQHFHRMIPHEHQRGGFALVVFVQSVGAKSITA